MPTYCSDGDIVGLRAVLQEVYLVLFPLIDHSLEEEVHGDPLVPDLPLKKTVLSAWLYSFQ